MKIFQKSIKPVAFNEIYLSSKICLKFCKMRKILRYIHTIMSNIKINADVSMFFKPIVHVDKLTNIECRLHDFLVKSSQELKQISPELAHTMQ